MMSSKFTSPSNEQQAVENSVTIQIQLPIYDCTIEFCDHPDIKPLAQAIKPIRILWLKSVSIH